MSCGGACATDCTGEDQVVRGGELPASVYDDGFAGDRELDAPWEAEKQHDSTCKVAGAHCTDS